MLDFVGKLLSHSWRQHPVFVVGTGRSGTSVLLQALGQHSRVIAMPGESPFLTSMGGNAALFAHTHDTAYQQAALKVPKPYLYAALRKLGLESAAGKHYGLVYTARSSLQKHSWPGKWRFWAAKTFPPEVVTKGLLSLYPSARFIYIRRNGIDVVHSMSKFHGFKKMEFTEHCRRWADDVLKYQHLLAHPQAIAVTHEDLVDDPRRFFKEILTFLDLPDEAAVSDYVSGQLVHSLDQPTQAASDVRATFKERVSPYSEWEDEQRETFVTLCGPAMETAGYRIPG